MSNQRRKKSCSIAAALSHAPQLTDVSKTVYLHHEFWNSRRKWRCRPKSLLTYENVILRSCPFFSKWKFKLIFLAVKNNVFVSTIYFQVSEIIVNSKPSMHHVDKMRWYSWTQLAMGACVWDVAWPEIMDTLHAQQMSWMKWISDAQEEDNAISTFLLWETLFNHVQKILPPIWRLGIPASKVSWKELFCETQGFFYIVKKCNLKGVIWHWYSISVLNINFPLRRNPWYFTLI